MPRPKTKEDLLLAAKENFEKLQTLISKLSDEELNTPFDFSQDAKKKEAHWRRDKNVRDVLIHLYEWHQLLLNWGVFQSRGAGAALSSCSLQLEDLWRAESGILEETSEYFSKRGN